MSSSVPRIDGNILPEAFRERRLPGKQKLLLVTMMVLMVLVVYLYSITTQAAHRKSELDSQLDSLNQQLVVRREKAKELAGMSNVIEQYKLISQKRGVMTDDLKAIVDSADEAGIDVISVEHEGAGNILTVDSRATGYSNFDEYRQAYSDFTGVLMGTGRFSSVDYLISDYPPQSHITIYIETSK